MTRLAALAFIILSQSTLAAASDTSIQGRWRFTKMIYQGNELPPRDPNLVLTFEFNADGTDRVHWTYDQGKTFCERRGKYQYDSVTLRDRVTWVNPRNETNCAQDSDMQLGRETTTPAEISRSTLKLHLPFGDDELVYVLERSSSGT